MKALLRIRKRDGLFQRLAIAVCSRLLTRSYSTRHYYQLGRPHILPGMGVCILRCVEDGLLRLIDVFIPYLVLITSSAHEVTEE
jgi:hypothetical protein